jgi:carbonic anhydrase
MYYFFPIYQPTNNQFMPKIYQKIFENNRAWVKSKIDENPDYFKHHAKGQKPPILWIGCSDSRVPANEITGTEPGEIFVHRNIANLVIHTDMNMLSVLDYAVNVLEVNHIIVCGHYGCGGISAALENKQLGIVSNWLKHIWDVYRLHKHEIDSIQDKEKRENRMVEVNIEAQVMDLMKTSIVEHAWEKGKFLQVHGLVYDVSNGHLKDLNLTFGRGFEEATQPDSDIKPLDLNGKI